MDIHIHGKPGLTSLSVLSIKVGSHPTQARKATNAADATIFSLLLFWPLRFLLSLHITFLRSMRTLCALLRVETTLKVYSFHATQGMQHKTFAYFWRTWRKNKRNKRKRRSWRHGQKARMEAVFILLLCSLRPFRFVGCTEWRPSVSLSHLCLSNVAVSSVGKQSYAGRRGVVVSTSWWFWWCLTAVQRTDRDQRRLTTLTRTLSFCCRHCNAPIFKSRWRC